MLELCNKLAQSYNSLYHWGQDIFQQIKDLIKNLETTSQQFDYQEGAAELEAKPTAEPLTPLTDPAAAD